MSQQQGLSLQPECEPSLPSKSLFRAKASGVFLRFQLLLSPNPDPPALNVCGSTTEVGGIRWYPPDLGMGSPPTVPGRQRFLRLKEMREGRERNKSLLTGLTPLPGLSQCLQPTAQGGQEDPDP